MAKVKVNKNNFSIKISDELLTALRATGEPTAYAREVLNEHFNINEIELKKAIWADLKQKVN
jgi:hypothetical protein